MIPKNDPLKDFRNFLYLVWKHLNLPEPTLVQYDIAHYLQHGPKRSIIQAFRGVGKSWITSAFVCWLLLHNPQLNIMVVSASKSRADDFSTFTLRLINDMPMLQHLRPRDGQRNSKIAFDVGPAEADHSPSVKSVGITGQLTGSRADVIIADDVEVVGNSLTQMMRDKLSELVKEFDAVLKPGGRIIYLGTPQTEMSLYNALPDRGYEIRIWPARYPSEKRKSTYGDRLAPSILEAVEQDPKLSDKPVDPKRFDEIDLLEREASYGRSGFALQFMLDTSLSDAEKYPLKLSDLIIMPLDSFRAPSKIAWSSKPELILNDLPNVGFAGDRYYRAAWMSEDEYQEYSGSVMYIDPSGRGKDETGYAVVKHLNGMLFLLESGGFLDGYSDATLDSLCYIAKRHKVNLVLYEPNMGDGMFGKLLTPHMGRIYPCTIQESEWSTTQKERRIIDTLEPVMNQHRLIVSESVVRKDFEGAERFSTEDAPKYQLFYQMTRITKDKGSLARDDRLDALAGAVNYWVESMARDIDKAVDQHRQKLLDADLKRFMDHALGRKTSHVLGWSQPR